jgi:hypothetical protein
VARRIEIELTSARPDGSWTWRAAGARQPRGVLDGGLLPSGAKAGDVLKAEADFEIEGISIVSVTAPKETTRPGLDRIEIIGSGRPDVPGVTNSSGALTAVRVNTGATATTPDRGGTGTAGGRRWGATPPGPGGKGPGPKARPRGAGPARPAPTTAPTPPIDPIDPIAPTGPNEPNGRGARSTRLGPRPARDRRDRLPATGPAGPDDGATRRRSVRSRATGAASAAPGGSVPAGPTARR